MSTSTTTTDSTKDSTPRVTPTVTLSAAANNTSAATIDSSSASAGIGLPEEPSHKVRSKKGMEVHFTIWKYTLLLLM